MKSKKKAIPLEKDERIVAGTLERYTNNMSFDENRAFNQQPE